MLNFLFSGTYCMFSQNKNLIAYLLVVVVVGGECEHWPS